MQKLAKASHSAVRALSVSAYNRGCMWHLSAPHRPCIGHRTGYSLHENARTSGLASADFEGVFAHSYKRWRPRLFFTSAVGAAFGCAQSRGRTVRLHRHLPSVPFSRRSRLGTVVSADRPSHIDGRWYVSHAWLGPLLQELSRPRLEACGFEGGKTRREDGAGDY